MFFMWLIIALVCTYFFAHAAQQMIDAGNENKKPTHDYRVMKQRQINFNHSVVWFACWFACLAASTFAMMFVY